MKSKYYVFGQDMRKVGAQIALDSLPEEWLMGESELTVPVPVPVYLDDPVERGDVEPSSGAGSLGDIISGAQSCYSTKLCNALEEFGIHLMLTPALIYVPGNTVPDGNYCLVRGVPDAECLIDKSGKLENFEIDAVKTKGLHMFDVHASDFNERIIDEVLKQHLEKLDLKGVYIIPTTEYGGDLKKGL